MRHWGPTGPEEQEERASQRGYRHMEHRTSWNQPEEDQDPQTAQRVRGDCRVASTPLWWELPGEGSHTPGLTSIPAAISLSADSDSLLEPGPNWDGKSATFSYFSVVLEHSEMKPDELTEGVVGLSGWRLLAGRDSSRHSGQSRKLRAHAFNFVSMRHRELQGKLGSDHAPAVKPHP